ncbi:hypothetical protein ACJA23_01245 [Mycoplasma corogypsi]|uniref:hypothetical protein n=1 Tax=Mycoplasma corogypsi TaxID=2106 RepID=UPI003872F4F9
MKFNLNKRKLLILSSFSALTLVTLTTISCLKQNDQTVKYAKIFIEQNAIKTKPLITLSQNNQDLNIPSLVEFEKTLHDTNILTFNRDTYNLNIKDPITVDNKDLVITVNDVYTYDTQNGIFQIILNPSIASLPSIFQPHFDNARNELAEANKLMNKYYYNQPSVLGPNSNNAFYSFFNQYSSKEQFIKAHLNNPFLTDKYDAFKFILSNNFLVKSNNISAQTTEAFNTNNDPNKFTYFNQVREYLEFYQKPKYSMDVIIRGAFNPEKDPEAGNIRAIMAKYSKLSFLDTRNPKKIVTYEKVLKVIKHTLLDTPFYQHFLDSLTTENNQVVSKFITEDKANYSFTFSYVNALPFNGIPRRQYDFITENILKNYNLSEVNFETLKQDPTKLLNAIYKSFDILAYRVTYDSKNGIGSGFGPLNLLWNQSPLFDLTNISPAFAVFWSPIEQEITKEEFISGDASNKITSNLDAFMTTLRNLAFEALIFKNKNQGVISNPVPLQAAIDNALDLTVDEQKARVGIKGLLWDARVELRKQMTLAGRQYFDYVMPIEQVEALTLEFSRDPKAFINKWPDLLYVSTIASLQKQYSDLDKDVFQTIPNNLKRTEDDLRKAVEQKNTSQARVLRTRINNLKTELQTKQRTISNVQGTLERFYEIRYQAFAAGTQLRESMFGGAGQSGDNQKLSAEQIKQAQAQLNRLRNDRNFIAAIGREDELGDSSKSTILQIITDAIANTTTSTTALNEMFAKLLFSFGAQKASFLRVTNTNLPNENNYYVLTFEQNGQRKYVDLIPLFVQETQENGTTKYIPKQSHQPLQIWDTLPSHLQLKNN